ncbi:MAG: helicase C-terminal domain-containing protein, partial [Desulfosarcinaceae bacterium]
AAGRVIRSAADRGVVALVDARFARADYRRLLPAYWTVDSVDDAGQLFDDLKKFWAQMDDGRSREGTNAAPAAVA